ncbi:DUF2561 family protein [Mycobacterium sp.]|uniref:DUF2561 family protein n=1 Tax=Mycobacterium sp. TaxID=1785 RepID=UPI00127D32A2|nr:DUF2561 family protein [Mycobacterium sp.]KAA8969324.1 MAG: DUF2561 family protein [Mycobacterium sp.]
MARQPGWAILSPILVDRVLVGLCTAVWLVLIGMSAAAVVALMDLDRGFHEGQGNGHTSSLLYGIIVISVLIILAAIPLLLRARRMTAERSSAGVAARSVIGQPAGFGYPSARVFDQPAQIAHIERPATLRPALPDAEVNRVWLRGIVFLLGPLGLALVGVATATYLMATGHQGAAWVMYLISGLITVALPVIVWRHGRWLKNMLSRRPQRTF